MNSDFIDELTAEKLIGKCFTYGGVGTRNWARITLLQDGKLVGIDHPNESTWDVVEGKFAFFSSVGTMTSRYELLQTNPRLVMTGVFLLDDKPKKLHVLSEVTTKPEDGIIAELIDQIYSYNSPFASANKEFFDDGYPHTNLVPEILDAILSISKPNFWLEIGSMLGGSAIRTANHVNSVGLGTQIVCIDPFVGDVNMWSWEKGLAESNQWRFLRLNNGRPTIYDRFLANVKKSRLDDMILPIQTTSIVGLGLISRLYSERRLSALPDVIYLDSAHETGETYLELERSWSLLQKGGILFGDDWSWPAVRRDVLKFTCTINTNRETINNLRKKNIPFRNYEGCLVAEGQWILCK